MLFIDEGNWENGGKKGYGMKKKKVNDVCVRIFHYLVINGKIRKLN